jgi:hypothetical protein
MGLKTLSSVDRNVNYDIVGEEKARGRERGRKYASMRRSTLPLRAVESKME